jgi:deferrochelatase/peroxidase EfeB
VLFHIRAHRFDLCFDPAERLMHRMAGYTRVLDEVHGFKFFDERDLLGFVDGTRKSRGDRRAYGRHDRQGEQAIGRTKLSVIEMPVALTGSFRSA